MITESKWLASTEPALLLEHVRQKVQLARTARGRRKLLLFAAACACRSRQRDRYDGAAWDVCERYADGLVSKIEYLRQSHGMMGVTGFFRHGDNRAWALAAATATAIRQINSANCRDHQVLRAESAAQAALVREVFGNPFRTVRIPRALLLWHDGTIPRLAQSIYDERAFDRLPILADALEDAGCSDAETLTHCRGNGTHVRGCWVVDLLLSKA
jgi:hypothetical protein